METVNKLVGSYTNKVVYLKRGIKGTVRLLTKEGTDSYNFEYFDENNKPCYLVITEKDIVTNEKEFERSSNLINNINLIIKICEN